MYFILYKLLEILRYTYICFVDRMVICHAFDSCYYMVLTSRSALLLYSLGSCFSSFSNAVVQSISITIYSLIAEET